ncbi:hypothetical protein ABT234_21645 [Streptomyces sp. NPDC001586]|uniref:hypothetical protein n=1 Tax=Streptomyces sp. NPDC001586 TaxID=3154387 RepID=UPI003320332B
MQRSERSSTEMKRVQMAANWMRVGVVTSLALLLSGVTAGALAAPTANPPRPMPSGAELPVTPGERISVSTDAMVAADARNGVRVISPAFAAEGTLRMDDRLVTAVVTVSCTAAPGSYEVRFGSPAGEENVSKIDRLWGTVRVAPAEAAEREDCARRVAELPAVSQEERWPEDIGWPATPWDVRSVRAGERMTASDGLATGSDGEVTLSSPAFTRSVVMHGAKLVSAVVQIRCDATPGIHVVHWNEEGKPARIWARYRVTAAAPGCQDPAVASQASAVRQAVPWLLGGAAVLAAAGAVSYVLFRRRRKASD